MRRMREPPLAGLPEQIHIHFLLFRMGIKTANPMKYEHAPPKKYRGYLPRPTEQFLSFAGHTVFLRGGCPAVFFALKIWCNDFPMSTPRAGAVENEW
jgi:hypothetical protein